MVIAVQLVAAADPRTRGPLSFALGAGMFDVQRIPAELHSLIPLAQRYGLADDWQRQDAVENSTKEERRALKRAVEERDDVLDAWLAGPEAAGPDFSDEYIAFSAMRMAADYA